MDNYFTPDISDIRIGYECEARVSPYPNWVKTIIEDGEEIDFVREGIWEIQVPYLTKEQIEGEGWITDKNYNNTKFTKQVVWIDGVNREIEMTYDYDTKILHLGYDCLDFMLCGIFNGKCRCINDFRLIMKLLEI